MNINLPPELEAQVQEKVDSGLYNDANEVISEALRFIFAHEDIVLQMKLDYLRQHLAVPEDVGDPDQILDLGMADTIAKARDEIQEIMQNPPDDD